MARKGIYLDRLLCLIALCSAAFVNAQTYTIGNGLISACSGTFHDSGGASGNYGPDENFTYTICPTSSSQVINVTFSAFDTEANSDLLRVFQGLNTSVLIGTYSNSNSADGITFTSSAPSGCLTFVFSSTATVELTGWTATISCSSKPPGVEICNNGLDDDNNGYVDSYDPQCAGPDPCLINNDEYNGIFTPSVRCSFATQVSGYASPMIADVDNDGDVEIIICTQDGGDGLLILNGNTCAQEAFIDFPGTVDPKHGNVALGDVDNDGYIDIFATDDANGDIFRIEFDGTSYVIVWTAPSVATADRKHLEIMDLNQDGIPEIIPNMGRMVNALTGAIYPGDVPGVHTHNKGIFAFTADADLGNNGNEGNVELVRGSEVYRYDFVALNWNLIRALPAPYNTIGWTETANVALADMDLDGDVDAVVSSYDHGALFIWDLQTTEILGGGGSFAAGSFAGRATIGNFDTDPYPEFAFVSANIIYGMEDIINANAGAGGFQSTWSAATTDGSGHTGMTLFDFEGDGYKELVYRDTDRLRVFRGRGNGAGGPLILYDSGASSCNSGTGAEFPVVADVTGDDQANIVVACNGSISVYQSGSQPWVSARRIWNTQSYFYTNVNDDGTIPAQFQENYLVFNDYMSQRGNYLGGDPTAIPAADIAMSIHTPSGDNGFIKLTCSDSLGVIVQLCNNGSTQSPSKVQYAVYENNPYAVSPAATLVRVDSFMIGTLLDPGSCFVDTLWFQDDDGAQYSLVANHVNGAGPLPIPADTTYRVFTECNYTNNSILLFDMTVDPDMVPPQITCPANISVNASAGTCGAVVNYTAPVGTDNCPGATTARISGPASGSTFPVGATMITYRVTDDTGNTAQCSFSVTVVDNQNPSISCPSNIVVSAAAGTCGAVVNYITPVGTDNCSGVTTVQTTGLASGSTFPVGNTVNTFQTTDAAGRTASCSFTVTVADQQNPSISCPANITVGNTAGTCGAVVTYTAPIGTDNCPGATTTQIAGLASGATYPVGITTNTFRVIDAVGRTATCSFTVTVNDTQNPAISCPANIVVGNAIGTCGAVVNYTAPIWTDNCPGATNSQIAGLPSGATFPLGSTINTFRVTDASGRTTVCSFTVTVNDTEDPTLSCPANITTNVDANSCSAVVNYTAPVGTDNCPGVSTVRIVGPASGSTFPPGTTTITYRSTDAAGNSSTCSFTVTVTPGNDNDGDGICDNEDLDDDNDGIPDMAEGGDFLDTDGDGVPNRFDLDSDNDGIYDVIEAGSGQTSMSGALIGAVTAFGIPVSVDANADNMVDYTIRDSDSDGNIDSLELDSDNDACYDVIEAGFVDHNSDGWLGNAPLTVDGNGVVTSTGL